MKRAVFMDKDGTLITDLPYNVDPNRIVFEPHALDAMRMLGTAGYKIIIISNQSGIARGYFSEENFQAVINYIRKCFSENEIVLEDFYFCPHHPNGSSAPYNVECDCRKPASGMILKGAADHDIDLNSSWMIGDILNDVEAGSRAGCKTVLINNGNETEWEAGEFRNPTFEARNLLEAARFILERNG